MSRIPSLKDLKKNFRKRFLLASIFVTVWLLTDEYLKEGYLWNRNDIVIPGTHEFIIFWLWTIYFFAEAIYWRWFYD